MDQIATVVDRLRHIEANATATDDGVDIVESIVKAASSRITAQLDASRVLVELTYYNSETYRNGVISEGYDTANVLFDAITGDIVSVTPVTLEALDNAIVEQATTAVSDEDGLDSDDGVPASTMPLTAAQAAFSDSAVAVTGGHLTVPTHPISLGTSLTSSEQTRVVSYANSYWDNYNTDYRKFDNDCTNFVSQALNESGGWSMALGLWTDNSNWWYNFANQTYSWAGAENWYRFARVESKRASVITNVYALGKGDILQAKWSGQSNMSHSMIVTGTGTNQIYLTYHSNDRHNVSFAWFSAQQSGETYYAHGT